jgi:predicted transglutaminase-like cysteine proteinase
MRGKVMLRLGFFAGVMSLQVLAAQPVISEPVARPARMLGDLERAPAVPPFGYVAFCEREPGYCGVRGGQSQSFAPGPEDWSTVNDVNLRINRRITAITDRMLYGVNEFWTLPQQAGDCEDFVLLKRRVLLDLGFPPSALLITVVRDEKGEGHAVLTLATTQGDFILDNRRNDIRRWNEVRYAFLKRQSSANPDVWVSLARDPSQPAVASAMVSGNR